MKYILISLLVLIVIIIIYLLYKNAKSNNFDLKYKENVLFIIPTFILIFTCLFNFEYNKQFSIDVIINDLQIKDDEFRKIKEENSIRK